MSSRTLLCLLCLLLPPASLSNGGEGSKVLVGSVRVVERKTKAEFERDKTLNAHSSAQYVVLDVERVVVGAEPHATILALIDVDRRGPGVEWFTNSYGILDPEVWREGRRVILFLGDESGGTKECPGPWYPRVEGDDMDGKAMGPILGYTAPPEFEPFRGSPVYCTSLQDVFLLAE